MILELLDNESLVALSGFKQPKKQVEWLRRWGIPHFVGKDGRPRVIHSDIEGAEKKLKGRRNAPRLEGLSQRSPSLEKS